jgi:hypothetical protein
MPVRGYPGHMGRLRRQMAWELPLTEVSALTLRALPSGGHEVVAASDEEFDVVSAPLDWSGAPGASEAHDVESLLPDAIRSASEGSEFEGVACDGDGRVFLLQEGPARVLVVAPGWDRLEQAIELHVDPAEPGLGAEWYGDEHALNSRGEALLLLRGGHMLVIKQRDSTRFIEFGPAPDDPAGLTVHTYLPPGEAFDLPADGDARYEVLATWPLDDGDTADLFPALNEVARGDDGRLYVLSSKALRIGQVDHVLPGDEAVKIAGWGDLPDDLPGGEDGRAEGLVMLDGTTPLISIDRKDAGDNLVRLERL